MGNWGDVSERVDEHDLGSCPDVSGWEFESPHPHQSVLRRVSHQAEEGEWALYSR